MTPEYEAFLAAHGVEPDSWLGRFTADAVATVLEGVRYDKTLRNAGHSGISVSKVWQLALRFRPADQTGTTVAETAVHFLPYGSYVASCGRIEDRRYPERWSDLRREVTCGECQDQMTDLGDLPPRFRPGGAE